MDTTEPTSNPSVVSGTRTIAQGLKIKLPPKIRLTNRIGYVSLTRDERRDIYLYDGQRSFTFTVEDLMNPIWVLNGIYAHFLPTQEQYNKDLEGNEFRSFFDVEFVNPSDEDVPIFTNRDTVYRDQTKIIVPAETTLKVRFTYIGGGMMVETTILQ